MLALYFINTWSTEHTIHPTALLLKSVVFHQQPANHHNICHRGKHTWNHLQILTKYHRFSMKLSHLQRLQVSSFCGNDGRRALTKIPQKVWRDPHFAPNTEIYNSDIRILHQLSWTRRISHYLLQRFSASLQDSWTINLATEQRFSFATTRFEVFRVGLQEHIAGATATHSDGLTAGDERLLAAQNIPMIDIIWNSCLALHPINLQNNIKTPGWNYAKTSWFQG